MSKRTMNERGDEFYEIEAQSKGWAVIEVIAEEQPITRTAIMKKLNFKRDIVERTLRTARLRGYAIRDEKTLQWRVGPRLQRLASDVRG